ncbi:MAG: response regulator transcription factor [Ignavibacteriae bacterium]|nr:response regulator transcription factor [Ignavibacteriota bacterium]
MFADDHAIVKDGLRLLFKSEPQFIIVGEASDGVEALDLIAKHKPDVAVLDISMPRLNGIEATKIIKNKYPDTRVLILTIHENEEYIQQMILAGADGYVVKNAEKKEIFEGVRSVAMKETFFSPTVSKVLLEGLIKRTRNKELIENDNYNKLTKREMEVFQLIAEGLTSKEISQKLFLSISTVNSHRMNIMKKLDIHDIASLVKYAIQKNLIAVKQ